MILPKDEKIIIVGAGCFGVSTAFHLLQRGYTDVSILERSTTLPAPDAASNDLNRIVRSSYDDAFYTEFARQAISSWKDVERWGDSYHESGVIVMDSDHGETYTTKSYKNDYELGARVEALENGDAIRSVFPPGVRTATFDQYAGYINRDGGWVNAGQALSMLIERVVLLKGKILPGKKVTQIIRRDGEINGVQCNDGAIFEAALIIIATGSWTPANFPDLIPQHMCLATGQCIAMIQLSKAEADEYRNCPVVIDFGSGFYIFPPNEDNIVKFARHSPGYTHFDGEESTISNPWTIASDPIRGLFIPKSALQDLRISLKNVYPDLAEKPFCATRLCWYNDSPDGDWIISHYPDDETVILATAGNGHAYKFFPVISRLVADLIENKLETDLVEKFAVNRRLAKSDLSRTGQVSRLDLTELCTHKDFNP